MSSGIVVPDFLFSIEKKMKVMNELSYMTMLASENTWWNKVAKTRPMEGKSERLLWLLSSASIEQLSAADGGENGGSMNFDELSMVMQENFPAYFGRGYRINKIKLLNTIAGGMNPLTKWAADVGTYGAYIPQRLVAQFLLNGSNINSYDAVAFFSKLHPVNPVVGTSLGTFANDFTGSSAAASGLTPAYPGACPIDDTQSIDTAFTNLSKLLSYITGAVKQPNGASDPRFLEPAFLLYPPRMVARVQQMLNADFIPQVASSGAGSGDVRAFFKKYRMMAPVEAKELDGSTSYTIPNPATGGTTTLTGSDTTFYIVCKEASNTELGGVIHNLRLPFYLTTYSGDSGTEGMDAVLGRSNDLEYHYQGWTSASPGHPYTIYRCQGS